ncbi:MAG TPA: patatin-like protein [Pyrinomonadaceae bacterium]|nr:patatin-like protein [Pyrinomonadaceae bacterium]
MSSSSSPTVNYTKEVRFAVVMYGGVSLAIYINGIAQEMLRWVRATAKDANSTLALLPSPSAQGTASASQPATLTGTERVYRKLSYILANSGNGTPASAAEKMARAEAQIESNETINTRFVVDILSGTSAGGINGIFLAKALANGQDISDLEKLWITEGEISTLINDARSVEKPLKLQDPPASLLNSQRMYLELLKAFDGMEKSNSGAPYVDELDLFVTTTDLSGVTLPIRLADGVVYERRHRNVLRFIYSKSEVSFAPAERNDFQGKYNPFLAFAARCTSAFPFAFEPMSLCDTDTILERYGDYPANKNCRSDSSEWQRFYKDYLNPAGVRPIAFPKRAFADGGYLDNKPFTYAAEVLARRQAYLPVIRKLIYIEPSPEHPEDVAEVEGKPDAIQNVSAALLSLPRYETIREDLQRLRDHNRLVDRVKRILLGVDKAIEVTGRKRKDQLDDAAWSKLDFGGLIKQKGSAYLSYYHLEVASVTDDLASVITRVAGFDEESDYFLIVRSLVRAWRDKEYQREGSASNVNEFLYDFNLSYPMRRINFLRTKIAEVTNEIGNQSSQATQELLLNIKKELNSAYKELRSTARLCRSREVPKKEAGSLPPSPAYAEIAELKVAIAQKTYDALPPGVRIKLADKSAAVLEYFLGSQTEGSSGTKTRPAEHETDLRAASFLENNPAIIDLFKPISEALKKYISEAKLKADGLARTALGLNSLSDQTGERPDLRKDPQAYLGYYYQYYDDYDMVVFPLLYGTDIGEAATVDILRISPEDAKALIDERSTGCYKLAGSSLGHFGAFLDPLWRKNDIMWGRLDGAERIITALLPEDPELARLLVGEAHAAIVHDSIATIGDTEARNLLCESAMRTRAGTADCELLGKFVSNLKTHDAAGLLDKMIDDKALQQHYVDTFPKRSKLDPESGVRIAARATTVVGKMLENLSSSRRVSTKPALWIARLGRIFWALVEVAVPRSFADLFFRHWLKLIYFLEALLILGGTLLLEPVVQRFAVTAFGVTAAVHLAVVILSDLIQSQNRWAKLGKAIGIALLITLIAVGGFAVSAILGVEFSWDWLHKARSWIAASQSGLKWAPVIIIFLVFLLSIRKDLKELFT